VSLAAVFLGLDYPAWAAIAIGSLVTVVVAVLIYRLQKSPKTLDYGSYDPVELSSGEEVFPGLRVNISWAAEFEGEQLGPREVLKDARVDQFRIVNTGRRAIKAADFQEPIEVSVPKGRLIDCVVVETSHPGIHSSGSVYVSCDGPQPDDRLSFTPALMNRGDWIDISVLTEGLEGEIRISSWIVDQSRPMKQRQRIILPSVRKMIVLQIRDGNLFFAMVGGLGLFALFLGFLTVLSLLF
jgi:hypothetical protein